MSDADYLVLDRVAKQFGTAGVRDLSLSLARGQVLALLGPSGSGKTTTLRLLAGFELPDRWRIVVGGIDQTGIPAVKRRFGMVFQHYALFPHLDVGANVAFGLEGRGLAAAEVAGRVAATLVAVDLAGMERRPVGSLSGGQQQRVALARALAPEPMVLLLDEPLSNLDPALRERTRDELRGLIARIGITTVLVTHEQEEAFDLADRVAVLHRGVVDQVGRPEDLYQRPATAFVASFVGRAALLTATVEPTGDGWRAVAAPGLLPISCTATGAGPADLAIRPEAFELVTAAQGLWTGRVTGRRFLGAASVFRVAVGGLPAPIEVLGFPDAVAVGETIGLLPTGRGVHAFAPVAG